MEDWRIDLLRCVPRVLETSSCLHVTLLVFLRLLAIQKPLTYAELHGKLRYISIIIIWIISIVIQLIALIILIFEKGNVYLYYKDVTLHSFHTFPVICIIIMYTLLIWTLKKKKREIKDIRRSMEQDTINKKMTLLVQRVVLVLIICYVPFLGWRQYYYEVVIKRMDPRLFDVEVITNKEGDVSHLYFNSKLGLFYADRHHISSI